jgi:hypothetical protein
MRSWTRARFLIRTWKDGMIGACSDVGVLVWTCVLDDQRALARSCRKMSIEFTAKSANLNTEV